MGTIPPVHLNKKANKTLTYIIISYRVDSYREFIAWKQ